MQFTFLVFEGEFADKFRVLHFNSALQIYERKSKFLRVPVRVYEFENWALSNSDPQDCQVAIELLSSALTENVSIKIVENDGCTGLSKSINFTMKPLENEQLGELYSKVSYLSIILIVLQFLVIYFTFCSKYNEFNRYRISTTYDCELNRQIWRNLNNFRESPFRFFYDQEDEEEVYFENHPHWYLYQVSLGSLLLITIAQSKLFFILVELENMVHNQLLTLAFMMQLVLATIWSGFMLSKVTDMAQRSMPDKEQKRIIYILTVTAFLMIVIIGCCRTSYLNFLDKRVLIVLFGGIWIP